MNKTIFMNVCNDVKELVVYSVEGIIWMLEKGKDLIEEIDFNEVFMKDDEEY